MTPDDVIHFQEHMETMWHTAASSIRGLLELAEHRTDDAEFRDITIYIAKCWLKDYEELDRRIDRASDQEAAE